MTKLPMKQRLVCTECGVHPASAPTLAKHPESRHAVCTRTLSNLSPAWPLKLAARSFESTRELYLIVLISCSWMFTFLFASDSVTNNDYRVERDASDYPGSAL